MDNQARQTAVKTRISSLQDGDYVVKEGWEPNYILYNGKKISRVNIIGVVVGKNQGDLSENVSVIIDDGSGRISIRSFDKDQSMLNNVAVGDVVILIGRPREYGNEIFIVPEILKPLEDKRWAEVRGMQLKEEKKEMAYSSIPATEDTEKEPVEGPEIENIEAEQEDAPSDSVLKAIRDLDNGEGADLEEVIASAKKDNAEDIITNLMKNGDIFELKPGKIKILE